MSSDPHPQRRPAPARLSILLILAAAAFVAGACGHSRGPSPPPSKIPQRPVLTAHQRGQEAILSFPYPTLTISGTPLLGITKIEVWRLGQEVPDFALELLADEQERRRHAQDLLDEHGLDLYETPPTPAVDPVTGEPLVDPMTGLPLTDSMGQPLVDSTGQPLPAPTDGKPSVEPATGVPGADSPPVASSQPPGETAEVPVDSEEDQESEGEESDTALDADSEAESDTGAEGLGDEAGEEGDAVDGEPELSEEEQLAIEIEAARNLLRSPPTPKSSFISATTRDFNRQAELVLAVEGADIDSTVVGESIALRLPLPPRPEEGPEIGYLFAVKVFGEKGKASDPSVTVALLPTDTPSPPQDVSVVAQSYGIQISWSVEEDPENGFRVYRREAQSRVYGQPVGAVAPTGRLYSDQQAVYGARYIYGVTSVDSVVPLLESDISSEHEIDYQDRFGPARPSGLVAFPETGRVRLLWTAVAAEDLAGYEVLRRANLDEEATAVNSELVTRGQYLDEGLDSGGLWRYSVVAIDEIGNRSEPSLEIEVRVP
jgi:hypothetical protein